PTEGEGGEAMKQLLGVVLVVVACSASWVHAEQVPPPPLATIYHAIQDLQTSVNNLTNKVNAIPTTQFSLVKTFLLSGHQLECTSDQDFWLYVSLLAPAGSWVVLELDGAGSSFMMDPSQRPVSFTLGGAGGHKAGAEVTPATGLFYATLQTTQGATASCHLTD